MNDLLVDVTFRHAGADKYIAAFRQLRASLAYELEGSGVGALQVASKRTC